jgi:hypothetical protein
MFVDTRRTLRGALAGAVSTGVWALQQPIDKRAFRSRYDDVELLGRFVTGSDGGWYAPGLAMHLGNGALFGAVYAQLSPRLPGSPAARGAFVALTEHVALWPAGRLSDRFHPGRSELPVLTGSRRAFWQAVWRHALFGALLGELERRLNPPPSPQDEEEVAGFVHYMSSNGHGDIEHAAGVARVDSGTPPE